LLQKIVRKRGEENEDDDDDYDDDDDEEHSVSLAECEVESIWRS
jgi:hypothetical protein